MLELWCWRRLLRVPWTSRRSNLSILKEMSPEYSLEGLMLKLKFQYFGHRMWRTDSWEKPWCWERVKAGEGDDRGQDGWMASPTHWTWVWPSSRRWWWTGKPGVLPSMGSQRVRHNWVTELQQQQKSVVMPLYMIYDFQCLKCINKTATKITKTTEKKKSHVTHNPIIPLP